jgi:Zn-dependent alcohol dehydrogenase
MCRADARIENATVSVFGIGCVGLSILQGAREKKCSRDFATDTNPKKAEWTKKFGANEWDAATVSKMSWAAGRTHCNWGRR